MGTATNQDTVLCFREMVFFACACFSSSRSLHWRRVYNCPGRRWHAGSSHRDGADDLDPLLVTGPTSTPCRFPASEKKRNTLMHQHHYDIFGKTNSITCLKGQVDLKVQISQYQH